LPGEGGKDLGFEDELLFHVVRNALRPKRRGSAIGATVRGSGRGKLTLTGNGHWQRKLFQAQDDVGRMRVELAASEIVLAEAVTEDKRAERVGEGVVGDEG
jgi:hypothetical protein